MALATRCPHCKTAFRVASDQLKLRAGLVRCGTCKEIFNGIENLLRPNEDLPAPTAALQPDAFQPAALQPATLQPDGPLPAALLPSDSPPSEQPPSDPSPQDPLPRSPTPATPAGGTTLPAPSPLAAPSTPSVLSAEAVTPPAGAARSGYAMAFAPVRLAPPSALATRPGDSILFDFSKPPVAVTPVETTAEPADAATGSPDEPNAEPHAEPETDPDASSIDALWLAAGDEEAAADASQSAVPADADTLGADHPSSDAAPLPGLIRPARTDDDDNDDDDARPAAPTGIDTGEDSVADPLPRFEEDDALDEAMDALDLPDASAPDFLARAQREQRMQRVLRPAMWCAFALLALGLIGQSGYALRTTIAATFPATRPLLEDACRVLGCSVGLPMQIELISIESTEFQPVADNPEQFQLNVLLRNRGTTVAAWPAIELSLNDAADKPLARRVFAPREYLPAGQGIAKGFAAASEQAIRLTFDLGQLKAAGYRVYVFYP